MPADDYADWGALAALQTFITNLNLASQTLQATAAEIAAEIAETGVPLLAAPVALYNNGEHTIAAGVTGYAVPNTASETITSMAGYLSYELQVSLTVDSTADVPFVTYHLSWYGDSAGDYLLYRETWTIPGSSNAALVTLGTGPVKGAYLEITVDNESSAHSQYIDSFWLYGNARPSPGREPDWRTLISSGYTVPNYVTPTQGNNTDGILGIFPSVTIAASGTEYLLFGMFNGQANITFIIDAGTSPSYQVTQYAQIAGYRANTIGESLVYTTQAGFTANSARSPLILQVTNKNASNSITLYVTGVIVSQL